jgi:hypothetical protein
MSAIQFTENYDDISSDRGYQFKFYCDRCHSGFISIYQTAVKPPGNVWLRAAGHLFWGALGSASESPFQKPPTAGAATLDAALKTAVEKSKPLFRQCGGCGKWVCPQVCFNAQRGLCKDCAPER